MVTPSTERSKLEVARHLASAHFRVDPQLRRIFLLEPLNDRDPNDPIKLLEVVEGTIERGIEPVAFAADPGRGLDYPALVVEISPAEFNAVREGKLLLANFGWEIGQELLAS
jgi:hypothetical protein